MTQRVETMKFRVFSRKRNHWAVMRLADWAEVERRACEFESLQQRIERELQQREEYNPRTGEPFKRGDFIKTQFGLTGRFWGYNRFDGVILVQTVPNSNTWQHSLRTSCLV